MKRSTLVIIALLLVAILAIVLGYVLTRPKAEPVTTEPITFPTATSTVAIPEAEIALRDGSRIRVNDFTKNQTTVADNQDSTILYLSGDPGLCQAGVSCPEGTDKTFTISFDTEESLFNIILLKEPLGQVRVEAQSELRVVLGITEGRMCDLNYSVRTLGFVSEVYGGQELGFSFCPGAVPLP